MAASVSSQPNSTAVSHGSHVVSQRLLSASIVDWWSRPLPVGESWTRIAVIDSMRLHMRGLPIGGLNDAAAVDGMGWINMTGAASGELSMCQRKPSEATLDTGYGA